MNFDNLPIVAYGYENTRPTERAPLMMVKLSNIGDQYPELATPLVRLSDVRAEVEALATQRQGEGENRKIAQLIIDNDRAGAVKWATGLIGNFDGPSCRIDPDATSQGVAVAQPDAREAALEQAANLVECEYAADATQGRRLAQIAQHIRDLKNRKPL